MEPSCITRKTGGVITHWSFARKMRVVLQVKQGILTKEQAYEHYSLSPEELDEWTHKHDTYGPLSLKATHSRRRQPKPDQIASS